MSLTVDQLKPLIAKAVTDAVNARIDPANRVGSMQRLAVDDWRLADRARSSCRLFGPATKSL